MIATITQEPADKPFDFIAGELCLDFCNSDESLGGPADWSYEYLLRWSQQARDLSDHDAAALRRLAARNATEAGRIARRSLELRKVLLRLFYTAAHGDPAISEDLKALNKEVADTMAQTRLEPAGSGYSLNCCTDDDLELARPLWPIVRSAVDLLTAGDLDRLGACAAHDCEYLFVDGTRNRSRQWCDTKGCGNRERVHRHREKKKELTVQSGR
jgi:predicted RNA-binding Zn ribbon-like protein